MTEQELDALVAEAAEIDEEAFWQDPYDAKEVMDRLRDALSALRAENAKLKKELRAERLKHLTAMTEAAGGYDAEFLGGTHDAQG